ncbi:aminopeptidase [uncultured Chryseobacterium sp.]|uniref:aminopeptidase n=1 Tax=uncultured Chryseobacterium sp. TaxID=259322 RepID=UPI00261B8DA1|nr:aminopeptidase [uncultured Chryseobacterium sp.]
MKKLVLSLGLLSFAAMDAQQDSVHIRAKLSEDLQKLSVEQNFTYTNHLDVPVEKIKLLNWTSAYKKNTTLSKRKLEDRKKDLYFSNENELGKLEILRINDLNVSENFDTENIYYQLEKPLQPGEKIPVRLQYTAKLPSTKFTGYGTSPEKISLKYFFIVPDGFETENQEGKDFNDINETQYGGNFWDIHLDLPKGYSAEGNLTKKDIDNFEGTLSEDPELLIKLIDSTPLTADVDGEKTAVVFGYPLKEGERESLEFYLPLQLKFIKEKIGFLPQKLFISEKFKDKEDFFGNDDIKFWKFKFQMFTDAEKTDLDYLSIITKKVVDQAFVEDKVENHWMKNGFKTYIEKEYLKKFYPEANLLGKLPSEISLFGFKPLKKLHAANVKLTERYGLVYQYIMSQNLDQKIGEPFTKLSNFNEMAISHFETGTLFDFVSEKTGTENFDAFLRNYLTKNRNKEIAAQDFLNEMSLATHYSSDFLSNYIKYESRVNFNLKNFKKDGDNFRIRIAKNTDLPVPFKITTETKTGEKQSYWYDTPAKKTDETYVIPSSEADKILLNDGYIFPEKNLRDNYLYTKGIFSNMKKLRFKLFRDIPNPEYNEVYINPKVNFNAYDKFLIGVNFKNKSLFEQDFQYTVTPYYSTGTQKFTGSASLLYNYRPVEKFYRNLQFGGSASHFHYDYDLAYRRFSVFSNLNFGKNPRSTISRALSLTYNHFDKDLTPEMVANHEYDKYNLWSLGFGYSDNKLIHEKYFGTNLQWMKDFAKLSAEYFYRWEYAREKKISFRLFGGYFFNNNTRNNLFDYGISRVSNYSFSYNLLGQSATSGILSQQYILAEGGFKSFFKDTANQWIVSHNIDAHVWKMFNFYADAGVYKNKEYSGAKFLYDTGVKIKLIPDFLEVYLPLQSSNGFEPSFKDYGKRIRYTLVFNFNALTNHFRRGWF